jgi:hypothetical protein
MSKARGLADLGNVYDDGALSNRNLIINGAMQVAQRGDFSSAATFISGQYWLDRWIFDTNNANSLVSQVGVDVPELSSKTKAARVEAGTTGSSYLGIRQKLEFPENYAGKTYTFSAYVRSNNVNARLTGYFVGPNQVIASDTHTGDGSWQRLSVTFTFSTTAASVAYFDGYISSNTVGPVSISAGDYLEITGVQLEVGDTATPFEHRRYSDELQSCMRYYEVISRATSVSSYGTLWSQPLSMFSNCWTNVEYKVSKRAVPSFGLFSGVSWSNLAPDAYPTVDALVLKAGGYFYLSGRSTGDPQAYLDSEL